MNISTKVWNYVKDRLSDKDREESSTTPMIKQEIKKPVFRATVGEGLSPTQAAKAKEIVTKKPSTKSLFTAPELRAELLPGAKEKIVAKASTDPVVKAESEQINPIQFTAGIAGRGLISAALQASGKNVYTPGTEFEKSIFGNEPVYNSKLTAKKIVSGENSIDVAKQGGVGMLALGLGINALDTADLFIGGGKKTAINKIAKLSKAEEIIPELRKVLGVSFDETLLKNAAEELKNVTDYTKVRDYIKELSGVNKVLDAQREAKMIDKSMNFKSPITKQSIDLITNSKDKKIISAELAKLGEIEINDNLISSLSKSKDPREVTAILNNTINQPKVGDMIGSINPEKLDMSPEALANFKKHYNAVKDDIELAKGAPVSLSEVAEAAQESEVLRKIFTRAEALNLGAQIQKAKNRLSYLENILVETKNPNTQKQIMEEIWDLTKSVDTSANFSGRLLNFFKKTADATEGTVVNNILRRIQKVGADREAVLNRAKDIDWNNPDAVIKFYREFVKPSNLDILAEYRYNAMLSNPRSHIRNISTNMLQTLVTRPLTRTIEAGIDMVSSALTGKQREVYFKEVPEYYRKALGNTFNALGEAWDAMKGKGLATQFMEAEGKIPTGKLPKFLRTPTLALEAGDRFFTKMIYEGEKAALMKRGVDEAKASKEASKAAQISLFRGKLDPKNKTGQGNLLSKIDQFTSIVDQARKLPGGDWIVPFLRTPMNIAKQMIEYSPLGLANLKGNTAKKEAFAKMLIGSTISAWSAKQAWMGNTTWGVPKDPEEKELFYASGRKPYSVKVGDKWVPMIYFGPLAYAMAIPAAIKYNHEDSHKRFTDSEITKLTKDISSAAQFWTQQTFLENLGNFMDLVGSDDGKLLDKNIGFLSTQLVPMSGLLRYVSTIIDPVYRKSNSLTDEITKGLPFLSRNLDAYYTPGAPGISGQESKREWYNYLAPWDIGSEKAEFEKLLQMRSEDLDSNNWLGRNNEALKKQAQSMLDDFMTGKGGAKRNEQIQKELNENEQLKNTFKSIVKKAGETEMAMADPMMTFSDPKYTAEIIYFRSQTAESEQEWNENVVDFIKMLEEKGLMTDEVKDELAKIATADAEKDKMETIEEESKKYKQEEPEWDIEITE